MRTVRLPTVDLAAGDALLGKFIEDSAYDQALDEPARVEKPDGTLLGVLVRPGLTDAAAGAFYHAVRGRIKKTGNRGTATGRPMMRQVKRDGTVSKSNRVPRQYEVQSAVMGYVDRYARIPFCREAAANEGGSVARALPAILEVDAVFREHAPEPYARQRAVADKTSQDFVLRGTSFTTLTLNRNFRTAGHRDAGDLPEGFGAMSVLRTGRFTGGRLVFPAYRVAFELRHGDVILFDPHEVHGNTEIRPLSAEYERITAVHYYRADMVYCGTAAQELELAKKHDDARKGPRSLSFDLKGGRK